MPPAKSLKNKDNASEELSGEMLDTGGHAAQDNGRLPPERATSAIVTAEGQHGGHPA